MTLNETPAVLRRSFVVVLFLFLPRGGYELEAKGLVGSRGSREGRGSAPVVSTIPARRGGGRGRASGRFPRRSGTPSGSGAGPGAAAPRTWVCGPSPPRRGPGAFSPQEHPLRSAAPSSQTGGEARALDVCSQVQNLLYPGLSPAGGL